jgi:hypothetical protein
MTPKIRPAVPKYGVVHLHGASGTAWTAHGAPGTPGNYQAGTVVSAARDGRNAVAADAGGPQTWGNQAAIDGCQRSYDRVQTLPGTKPGKVWLIGASMGGLTALNWAAANPNKVAGIIMIIPVINLNDVKVNNRGGYAGLVNTAHGGNYNESTMGATKNPATMAGTGKYAGIPIQIFYGLTDTVCVPWEAEAFAAAVGANVEMNPLNSGHDDASYRSVDYAGIIDFMNSHE